MKSGTASHSGARGSQAHAHSVPRDAPITDPRFANIQTDPRYRLPGKKDKAKLDKRFRRVLHDDDFTRRAKVDRYGRPLEAHAERKRLKRKYEFVEDDEEDEDENDDKNKDENNATDDELDDDHQVRRELSRLNNVHDPLRDGRHTDSASSADETTSDEESADEDLEEEVGIGPAQEADVPTGDVTARIAIVNLDWDNIRAADLMAVFTSFLPAAGALLHVAIYPSEFGRERLEREELEGPPKEIFARATSASKPPVDAADVDQEDADPDCHDDNDDDDDDDGDDDDENSAEPAVKPDDGVDFDSKALRRYQLERLRYYYAILTFSSPDMAKLVYDAVDGTEYLRTANFFDLRFVPDDTDFSADVPREECDRIPDGYRPNDFVTDALQHSKVKLTWDADDGTRKDAVAKAFRGSRRDIEENDLRAYLGSDSSEDDDADGAHDTQSRKEAERTRMRALLGLAAEPVAARKKDKGPVGGMKITFTPGLSEAHDTGRKHCVFENSPEPAVEETTAEKYIRKERERKQKRKDKMKAARDGPAATSTDPGPDVAADHAPDVGDLGFDDPFFADATEASAPSKTGTKVRKEERLRKRREREAEAEAQRKQLAELELLMGDDDRRGENGQKIQHFDMREIERAELAARKKDKKGKKKHKTKNHDGEAAADGADFHIDTADPRFARLYDSHEYAIDPTNPRFKATQNMQALLEEGRKRKNKKAGRADHTGGDKGASSGKAASRRTRGAEDSVHALVDKIKRQTART